MSMCTSVNKLYDGPGYDMLCVYVCWFMSMCTSINKLYDGPGYDVPCVCVSNRLVHMMVLCMECQYRCECHHYHMSVHA